MSRTRKALAWLVSLLVPPVSPPGEPYEPEEGSFSLTLGQSEIAEGDELDLSIVGAPPHSGVTIHCRMAVLPLTALTKKVLSFATNARGQCHATFPVPVCWNDGYSGAIIVTATI